MDLGVNFFDTADIYGFGRSEEVLEQALGSRKKDVVIATKFGVAWNEDGETFRDCSPRRLAQSLEGSLRRLKVDCIPIYQIHWHDNVTPIHETIDALKMFQDAGKIRHVSCSNFPMALIREALRHNRIESLQCLYNLLQRENEEDMKECSGALMMGTIAYGTIVRGLLSGKFRTCDHRFGEKDTRGQCGMFRGKQFQHNMNALDILTSVSQRYGKTCAQTAIRYVLDKPYVTCALVGNKTAAQVDENIGSLGWRLSEADMRLLDGLGQGGKGVV